MSKLIIVCGTPGSGKTTYAKKIAAASVAALLDIDTVTERLVKVGMIAAGHSPNDRDSDYFKRTYREPVYQALFDIARDNLPFHDVVITGPFTKEIQDPNWPEKLAREFGSQVEVHYIQCSPEIRRQRLAARGDNRDLAKLQDWDRYIKYYGEEHPPVFEHVLVDSAPSSCK